MNLSTDDMTRRSGGIFYTCFEDLRKDAAWTVHIREVVDEWTRRGEDVTLFIPKIYPFASPPRCRVVPVPTVDVRYVREYLYLFLLPFSVFFHGIKKKPRTVYSREMAFMPGVALACRFLGVPLVMEINGSMLMEHALAGTSRMKILILGMLERLSVRVVDHLVFVTKELAETFQKAYRLKDTSCHVVTNGVNTELFSPKDRSTAIERLGLDPGARYVTFVGSFYPHSQTPLITSAAPPVIQDHPDAVFLLVGDGTERALCERIAAELSIRDRVIFTGMKPHEDIPGYIGASSVLIYLIAGYSSGGSLKMLEYLSSGGVVVSNIEDIYGKKLVHGAHYCHIEDMTPESLAEAITVLLSDAALVETIRENSRNFVLQHFSWEKTAKRLIEVIDAATRHR